MDCFLLEGPKFIFRTGLAILRLNQSFILKNQDTFILLQIMKELAKHIFDMETLFQVKTVLPRLLLQRVLVAAGVFQVGTFPQPNQPTQSAPRPLGEGQR